MSSKLLEYSNKKVCARYYGQNQRLRLFSTVDSTTCKKHVSCFARPGFVVVRVQSVVIIVFEIIKENNYIYKNIIVYIRFYEYNNSLIELYNTRSSSQIIAS